MTVQTVSIRTRIWHHTTTEMTLFARVTCLSDHHLQLTGTHNVSFAVSCRLNVGMESVCLTFGFLLFFRLCNWLSETIQALYDYLQENDYTATMFFIGSNVIDWPFQAQRGLHDGHEVSHPLAVSSSSSHWLC